MSDDQIVKTVCSTCYCGCGVLAHIREGKVVKTEGDPDHPNNKGRLCTKGKMGAELLYHPDRLNYPLKRAGEKGEGKWQRISWDEALDTIASRLEEIREQDGPESIVLATGAGLYYNMGLLGYMAQKIGTPNIMLQGHVCFMPAGFACRATIGYESSILCTELMFDEVLNSNCILLWAANPRNTVPYPTGEGIFEVKEQRGTKLIVVDPRPTDYAKIADLWLQIRPATDDALALGMLNVIINEELYDKKFVTEWTYGFDQLKKHVQEYTPERVSEITWVPAEKIVAAARMFAQTRPSCVCQRVPLDQTENAVQTSRAILMLTSICGNLDIKGGNLLPHPPEIKSEFALFALPQSQLPQEVVEKRIGAKEVPLLSGPDAGYPIVRPEQLNNQLLTDKPYKVRAVITSGKNPLVTDRDSRKVLEALKKLEFYVVIDLFMTPSAELADIVLPAASWLERDGLRGHPAYPFVTPVQHKAVEPLYERWDDVNIFTELGKKMNLDLSWDDVIGYIDFRLEPKGIAFRDLEGANYIALPKDYDRVTKGKFEFKTPSKKVELYSTFLEKFGHDPLPHYKAPPEPTSEFPLIMTGMKNELYMHSAGRQIETTRSMAPDPVIEMSPETAEEKGIKDGDWVWLETIYFKDKDRVRFRAKLVEGFLPKVVAVEHGWWFPERHDPEHGAFESNISVVVPDDVFDPIYGSSALKGLPCRVYKA